MCWPQRYLQYSFTKKAAHGWIMCLMCSLYASLCMLTASKKGTHSSIHWCPLTCMSSLILLIIVNHYFREKFGEAMVFVLSDALHTIVFAGFCVCLIRYEITIILYILIIPSRIPAFIHSLVFGTRKKSWCEEIQSNGLFTIVDLLVLPFLVVDLIFVWRYKRITDHIHSLKDVLWSETVREKIMEQFFGGLTDLIALLCGLVVCCTYPNCFSNGITWPSKIQSNSDEDEVPRASS